MIVIYHTRYVWRGIKHEYEFNEFQMGNNIGTSESNGATNKGGKKWLKALLEL